MKKVFFFFLLLSIKGAAQQLTFKHKQHQELLGRAWDLAVTTIDKNTTPDNLLKAGGLYGGEWTRDCSINSWNYASLFRPKVAEHSLWSVTKNRDTIGHQYWDKIIWAIGAWNHFQTTNDPAFLRQAYKCVRNTMAELEQTAFNPTYNLFTGPGVINDGIAAYPEPIFVSNNKSSYVLDHKRSKNIMVLSTNMVYLQAYAVLNEMNKALGQQAAYTAKYQKLKQAILKHFYNAKENKLNYYIDGEDGKVINMQEGLGYSFALLFDLLPQKSALDLIKNTVVSRYGITNVYPHLERYSDSMPGRHNHMVWGFINAFWTAALAKYGLPNQFLQQVENQAHLALDADKGANNFYEIANALTGKPDGGWQSGRQWKSVPHQTWNATGYCSNIVKGLFGLSITPGAISFSPCVPKGIDEVSLSGVTIQGKALAIKLRGQGTKVKELKVNGKKVKEVKLGELPVQSTIEVTVS